MYLPLRFYRTSSELVAYALNPLGIKNFPQTAEKGEMVLDSGIDRQKFDEKLRDVTCIHEREKTPPTPETSYWRSRVFLPNVHDAEKEYKKLIIHRWRHRSYTLQ